MHAEVRLFDRLFSAPHPGRRTENFLDDLNPKSKQVITAYLIEGLVRVHGYAGLSMYLINIDCAGTRRAVPTPGAPRDPDEL